MSSISIPNQDSSQQKHCKTSSGASFRRSQLPKEQLQELRAKNNESARKSRFKRTSKIEELRQKFAETENRIIELKEEEREKRSNLYLTYERNLMQMEFMLKEEAMKKNCALKLLETARIPFDEYLRAGPNLSSVEKNKTVQHSSEVECPMVKEIPDRQTSNSSYENATVSVPIQEQNRPRNVQFTETRTAQNSMFNGIREFLSTSPVLDMPYEPNIPPHSYSMVFYDEEEFNMVTPVFPMIKLTPYRKTLTTPRGEHLDRSIHATFDNVMMQSS